MGRSNGAGLMAGRNDLDAGGSDLPLPVPYQPNCVITGREIQVPVHSVIHGWLSRDDLLPAVADGVEGYVWTDIGCDPIPDAKAAGGETDAGTDLESVGRGSHTQQGEKAHQMQCWLHPRYKAIRKPRAQCGICWLMWNRHVEEREARTGLTGSGRRHRRRGSPRRSSAVPAGS